MPTRRASTVDPRLATDAVAVSRFFRSHWPTWFPREPFIELQSAEVVRNFLKEFRSLTMRYDVTIQGPRRHVIIRGQARSLRHEDPAAPRLAYRATSFLVTHGFRSILYRPLGYWPRANLFVYEHLLGTELMVMCQTRGRQPWLEYGPGVARFLRKLHAAKRPPGLPARPRVSLDQRLADHLRLIRQGAPAEARIAQALWRTGLKHVPSGHATLVDPHRWGLTHGDFHLGHAVVDHGQLHYIDFSDCAWQDPLFDVGRMIAQTPHQSPRVGSLEQVYQHAVAWYFGRRFSPTDQAVLGMNIMLNLLQMWAMEVIALPRRKRARVNAWYLAQLRWCLTKLPG